MTCGAVETQCQVGTVWAEAVPRPELASMAAIPSGASRRLSERFMGVGSFVLIGCEGVGQRLLDPFSLNRSALLAQGASPYVLGRPSSSERAKRARVGTARIAARRHR